MPELAGFSHVALSVRDLDTSSAWYSDVLGFNVFEKIEHDEFREHVMLHPAGAILCLQNHHANAGETFAPQRTGMDHFALRVADRAELDAWEALFVEKGVKHTSVVEKDYGAVLCFRDPDDIQLEMFHRENHP
jgi:glyoxylase I family protein